MTGSPTDSSWVGSTKRHSAPLRRGAPGDRVREQILGIVSHDPKNPLAGRRFHRQAPAHVRWLLPPTFVVAGVAMALFVISGERSRSTTLLLLLLVLLAIASLLWQAELRQRVDAR